MKEAKLRYYSNAVELKITNKRVSVIKIKDGNYVLNFKRLTNEVGTSVFCENIRGVMNTEVYVSEQSLEALHITITEMLKKREK